MSSSLEGEVVRTSRGVRPDVVGSGSWRRPELDRRCEGSRRTSVRSSARSARVRAPSFMSTPYNQDEGEQLGLI
ncbi:hypothetical protein BDA96_02G274500 [Sorghum bicolor]|uniref:Uncharacterized protein n=1 Tax=Sorghum bicolor TaxID=4558 RepID=A0A921RS10_SORBI|nr:hypothetical protein BDA96_02G274500 [Sorghum bicolor]